MIVRARVSVVCLTAMGLLLVACSDDSSSDASGNNETSTTVTTADTTTSTSSATSETSSTEPTTSATTVPTSSTTEVDRTDACAVAGAWFAAAGVRESATLWELMHPNSHEGYGELDDGDLDELQMSWGPWATAGSYACTTIDLQPISGDRAGFLALTGEVDIETAVTLTLGLPVRQHETRWRIDPFNNNQWAELVSPPRQNVVTPPEPVDPDTDVVIDTTLITGPLEAVLVVDGGTESLVFDDHPSDPDKARAVWSPPGGWSAGTHWLVAALVAENGTISTVATRFDVT